MPLSPLGIFAKPAGISTSFESIATVTVGAGGSSSANFTSIPSTYKHLQVRVLGRNTRASSSDDRAILRFNSDSGSNYSYHYIYGNGSSVAVTGQTNQTEIDYAIYFTASTAQANTFGVGIIDILDYGDTNKYKTVRCLSGYDLNGSGVAWMTSGSWRSTSAVTSVNVIPANGNFPQYTSIALYGIKG